MPPDELSMPGCSTRLMGAKPSRGIVGKVQLEKEPQFSDPFKRMIGHASITERFNWILGEGWYMSVNIGSVSVNPPGCVAQVVAFAFGLAASSFFPAIILGIFYKRMNREGAVAGIYDYVAI